MAKYWINNSAIWSHCCRARMEGTFEQWFFTHYDDLCRMLILVLWQLLIKLQLNFPDTFIFSWFSIRYLSFNPWPCLFENLKKIWVSETRQLKEHEQRYTSYPSQIIKINNKKWPNVHQGNAYRARHIPITIQKH